MLEYSYLLRIGVALLLSIIIGWERERSDKEAGVRTICLISLGTVVFTIVPYLLLVQSKVLGFSFDFSRIIAYIIGSVGFLSGIVIIRTQKHTEGITTAACIFSVVSMSMLAGMGEYVLAIIIGILTYLILKSKYFKLSIVKKQRSYNGRTKKN